MANNCFICSIDRYTFDRYTDGFANHITCEHNMWQYVFFLVYLHQKDPNNYTGAESHVDTLVKKNDAAWFPVNQVIH
jgi:inositol 1,4,5-triphosphate receptor type 1